MSPAPGRSPRRSASREYLKRATDVAIGSLLLVVTAPVILLSAAAVRVDSGGPAFFRQERVGRGRKPFTLVKLRTMRQGAELGPDITVHGDPRVTRVGRFLRNTKIDELPQLWNVVRGDMSLVGPRPEQPRIVDKYLPDWAPLLEVRPGLTDEATLAFRNEAALLKAGGEGTYERHILPAKASIALIGLQRQSLASDLLILALTAGVVTGLHRPREHPAVSRLRMHLSSRRGPEQA